MLEFKPYRGVLASYRHFRVIFLKSDDLIYITDTMTWSRPAVHNMIPLPRSLHSATTIGKRFVTCHVQLLFIYLAKAVCLVRNTFSHGVPVSKSGLIHQQGATEVIFTACHSGKLRLVYTSPNVILTSPKNFLMSRIDFTVLL